MSFAVSLILPHRRGLPRGHWGQPRWSLTMLAGAGALMAGGMGIAGMAQATVINNANTTTIYQDLFNRGSSGSYVNLNGATPTTDNYAGTPTWNAYDNTTSAFQDVYTDGTQLDMPHPNASQVNGFLPFAPQAGHIYDLSAAMAYTNSTATGNWMALGFSQYNYNDRPGGSGTTDNTGFTTFNPYAWLLQRAEADTGGGVQAFMGVSTQNGFGNIGSSPAAGVFETYDVVLNTSGSLWTVAIYQNGTQLGATKTYTTNPNINFVGLGAISGVSAEVQNFTLTDTPVPAPATLALFAVGGLAILATRRRQRSD